MREDSLKQVYYINTNGIENLLYNFNLNVGDSIPCTVVPGPQYLHVDSVDSVFVYNKYRRRINFDWNGPIVEGIGNCLWGLLGKDEMTNSNWICGEYDHLKVYFYNNTKAYCYGQTKYPNDTTATLLNCTLNGIESITANYEIIIYPNPARNSIQVEESNCQIKEVKLLDVLGKEILNTTEKNIDVSGLQEGVYFVQVKTTEGISTQKVMVQH